MFLWVFFWGTTIEPEGAAGHSLGDNKEGRVTPSRAACPRLQGSGRSTDRLEILFHERVCEREGESWSYSYIRIWRNVRINPRRADPKTTGLQ